MDTTDQQAALFPGVPGSRETEKLSHRQLQAPQTGSKRKRGEKKEKDTKKQTHHAAYYQGTGGTQPCLRLASLSDGAHN